MAKGNKKHGQQLRQASRWTRTHEFRYPQAGHKMDRFLGKRYDRALRSEDSAGELYNALKKRKWGRARRIGKGKAKI